MLKSYDLEKFVNGIYKCSEKSCVSRIVNVEYKFWVHQEQMISSQLVGSMNDEFVKKVEDYDTSCERWLYVDGYFPSYSRARIMQYKAEMSAIKKEGISISEYVQRV